MTDAGVELLFLGRLRLLELEHAAKGANGHLDLVVRRLARGQPLEPHSRREHRHQKAIVLVLAGVPDHLVGEAGDDG